MKQKGSALIAVLALMAVIAVLASSGMRQAIAELLMAGNEQFKHAASTAASAGIEAAIAQIASKGGASLAGELLQGKGYEATIRYTGDEANLPGSSVGKFVGRHYEVTSVGTSSRQARDEQVQGVMVMSATANGVTAFRRIERGLEAEVAP